MEVTLVRIVGWTGAKALCLYSQSLQFCQALISMADWKHGIGTVYHLRSIKGAAD